MRRREFIAVLAGAAAWPLAASAQQPTSPVIGFLNTASPAPFTHLVAAFLLGLSQTGYVEGQNVVIEYRWAEGRYDQLPALATELVRRPVDVLVTSGGEPSAAAAKAATTTIPIVVNMGRDLVVAGLVASLARPGGNVTGVMQFTGELAAKRLSVLHELVPSAKTVALLVNPKNPNAEAQTREAQEAARMVGLQLHVLSADVESDFEVVLASLVQVQADALLVGADPSFFLRRDQFVASIARRKIPAIYDFREFVDAGGLMSYGANLADAYRQLGIYAGRALKGEKPADLPVMQSTRFELVINLKAAKALGLTVPDSLLALADEVIE